MLLGRRSSRPWPQPRLQAPGSRLIQGAVTPSMCFPRTRPAEEFYKEKHRVAAADNRR